MRTGFIELMSIDAKIDGQPNHRERAMRTTLTLDDELYAQAVALAEPGMEKAELLKACVKAFIQVQTARRLADLGGQIPDMELAPRRRESTPAP